MTVWVLSYGSAGESTLLDVYANCEAGVVGAKEYMQRDSLPGYDWKERAVSEEERKLGIRIWDRPKYEYLHLRPRVVRL